MTQTSKDVSIGSVMTGVTGLMCGSFGDFHEASDVLFPGITTLGLAYMHREIQSEMRRQFPDVAAYVDDHPYTGHSPEEFTEWFAIACKSLPLKYTLTGPAVVSEAIVQKNCRDFFDGVREAREQSGAGPLEAVVVVVE